MKVANQIQASMKENSKEEMKIKREWVTSLFDAMAMAGKVQNNANFLRNEQIRPCLGGSCNRNMFQSDHSDRMAIWR